MNALAPAGAFFFSPAPESGKVVHMLRTMKLSEIEVPDTLLREGQPDVEDLLPSVRELGILQPLLVRQTRTGATLLVAGKRRFTAAQLAGLTEVPVIVRDDLDDRRARIAELTENLARRDMSAHQEARGILELICFQFAEKGMEVPLEEAKRILYRLSNEFTGKIKDSTLRDGVEGEVVLGVFDMIGRSFGAFVTGVLPALSWPKDIRDAMDAGLSRSAARQLASIKDDQLRKEATERVQAGEKAADVKEEVLAGAGEHRKLDKDLSVAEQLERVKQVEGWLPAFPALDAPEATGLDVVPRDALMEELLGRFPRVKSISVHELLAEDVMNALRLGVSVWTSAEDPRFEGEHDSLHLDAHMVVLADHDPVEMYWDAVAEADQRGIPRPKFALVLPFSDLYRTMTIGIEQAPSAVFVVVAARGEAREAHIVVVV